MLDDIARRVCQRPRAAEMVLYEVQCAAVRALREFLVNTQAVLILDRRAVAAGVALHVRAVVGEARPRPAFVALDPSA